MERKYEIIEFGEPQRVNSGYCYYDAFVVDVKVRFEGKEYTIAFGFGHTTVGSYDEISWYDEERDMELYYYGDESNEPDAMTEDQYRQACESLDDAWREYEYEHLYELIDDANIETLEDLYMVFDQTIDDNRIKKWYKSDRCFDAVDPTLNNDFEVIDVDWLNPVEETEDTVSVVATIVHAGEYDFNVMPKVVVITFDRQELAEIDDLYDACYVKFLRTW